MRTPSLRILTDSCVVYAPPDPDAVDSEGAASLEPGVASPALRCLMDANSGTGQAFTRQGDSVPMGVSRRNVIFASDPGVTAADQQLVVTTREGTVFTLRSLGPCEPPYGVQHCWNVAADLKA